MNASAPSTSVIDIVADGSNGELVERGAPVVSPLEAQTRGEIDQQITTARRFPRSITQFKVDATALATLDEETAESCIYALPRGGKTIEGPSARLAEIVASCWGHMRTDARIVAEDDRFITARAVSWDLQTNVSFAVEVRRRITNKRGEKFNDDMIGVTANAAISIALRNAVFKVVPNALTKSIYRKARQVAVGDASTLANKRAGVFEYFGKMGVTPEMIYAKLGIKGEDDIALDHIALLKGMATAIKDGDISDIDMAFRPYDAAPPQEGERKISLGAKTDDKPADDVPAPGRRSAGRQQKNDEAPPAADPEPQAKTAEPDPPANDPESPDAPASIFNRPTATSQPEPPAEPSEDPSDDPPSVEDPESVFDVVFNILLAKHEDLTDAVAEAVVAKWMKTRQVNPDAMEEAAYNEDESIHKKLATAAKRAKWAVYLPAEPADGTDGETA